MDWLRRLQDLDDEDIDRLPPAVRGPVRFGLAGFMGLLVNGMVLFFGTILGIFIHEWAACGGLEFCGRHPGMPYHPLALISPDLGLHAAGYKASAVWSFGLLVVANLAVQTTLDHDRSTRIASLIPGLALAAFWLLWYVPVLLLTWTASQAPGVH